jgi:hypothetical protein
VQHHQLLAHQLLMQVVAAVAHQVLLEMLEMVELAVAVRVAIQAVLLLMEQ